MHGRTYSLSLQQISQQQLDIIIKIQKVLNYDGNFKLSNSGLKFTCYTILASAVYQNIFIRVQLKDYMICPFKFNKKKKKGKGKYWLGR